MAQYRVKEKSFIGNALREAGDVVDFDGAPSSNLEPLDAPAQAAVEASAGSSEEDKLRLQAAVMTGDPSNATLLAGNSLV